MKLEIEFSKIFTPINILIVLCIIVIILGYINRYCNCPPSKIIYRIVNMSPIDYQFSKQNLPSQALDELFTRDNSWIGGYKLNYSKKTKTNEKN